MKRHFLSFLTSFLSSHPGAVERDPVPPALLAAIRIRGGAATPEPSAWFATSVLARIRREESEQAERRMRRQHWARVLIPSGLVALFILLLGIGEHAKTVSEEDQVTFAALDAIAQGGKGTAQANVDGASVPLVVEGVSWSAP
ncbi:hypothetical protein SAMN05444156_2411 [Verrucomicrobium sp. GAS474]|uniref:hypothetical protein n=1 Tax=Verrucomicrobium sp. GAS474 TaxID=1882831 RepID=UPI00087929AC|nr:hypothetical protein [Verrucomicrobium sp. GAS474]SDU17458.1 hypothetical protein SAMN05444156_2411 [Verrucomicrobium sp. GAS474]